MYSHHQDERRYKVQNLENLIFEFDCKSQLHRVFEVVAQNYLKSKIEEQRE